MKLGEKIKLLRTEQQMTQPDLAKKAGIEQSYLSKLENDKAIPSFDIINRLSMSLGKTAMVVIDSLSQNYVEDNLSHIPEVAAEYAVIKHKHEKSMKKRFILAALTVVMGIGLSLLGASNLLFPEVGYNYYSNGVIKSGESIKQFSEHTIQEINESNEEKLQRLIKNRGRFDRVYLQSKDTNAPYFIKEVDGGKRLYKFHKETTMHQIGNDMVLILGIMLIFSGLFIFLFNFRFKLR